MVGLQVKVKRKYAQHAMTLIYEFAETDMDESDDEEKLAKRVYENSEPMNLLELLKHPKERSYVGRINEPHPHILTK